MNDRFTLITDFSERLPIIEFSFERGGISRRDLLLARHCFSDLILNRYRRRYIELFDLIYFRAT